MIIFLYGPDTFRSTEKLNELRKKFQNDVDPDGSSIKVLDGEKMTIADYSAATTSHSLFAKRRLIIIKNIFSNKNKDIFEELSTFLKKADTKEKNEEDLKNENIIIFIDDSSGDKLAKNSLRQFLLKQKLVQEFLPLSLLNLNTWVVDKAAMLGAVLLKDEASIIASQYGNDMWKIENELKKLINYKRGASGQQLESGNVIIERNDLFILAPGKINENIFAFTDALGNKEKAKALRYLEKEIEAGLAETQLLNMVIRQFKILLQLRQALDQGISQQKISTMIKMHPYVMQKSLRQARNFSLHVLKELFAKLVELDRDIKTGKADFKLSLDLLLADL